MIGLDPCPTCKGFKDRRAQQCRACRNRSRPARAGLRSEAAEAGALTYIASQQCKAGHSSERYTSSGGCIECSHSRAGRPRASRAKPAECECCGSPPGKKGLALDHDHVTGKFRGWLCVNCNSGIGRLGDNIAGLRRAITYLENSN